MGSETEQEILQVIAQLKELSQKKDFEKAIESLEEQRIILDINPQAFCSRINSLCGKYVLT
ncbi:hypothetical protein KAT95_01815 [Candidatus Parcubacteria bacterium]|nr:hypothetical protein [Candidatus Parcubacteria bacterium]